MNNSLTNRVLTDSNYLTGKKFRHIKRGSEYEVLGIAWHQNSGNPDEDGKDHVVYKTLDYSILFTRPLNEFLDGRFEEITND